jgi:hypothetical protein
MSQKFPNLLDFLFLAGGAVMRVVEKDLNPI